MRRRMGKREDVPAGGGALAASTILRGGEVSGRIEEIRLGEHILMGQEIRLVHEVRRKVANTETSFLFQRIQVLVCFSERLR